MPKRGVKVLKKSVGNDQDISRIFNEMLSTDQANINIAWPKYVKLIEHIDEFVKIFVLLKKSIVLTKTKYSVHIAEIDAFLSDVVTPLDEYKNAPFYDIYSRTFVSLNELDADLSKDFREKYSKLKTSNIVNALQVICDVLMHYQHDLKDATKLDPMFIDVMPGVEFRPFKFTTLDYKDIFLDEDIDDNAKRYLLLILHKVFTLSYDVYQLISTPDIDVDEFVDIILQNLEKLKKHAPGLERCNKAFNKIKKSAQLLKTNFNTYFKDLQETKSPTIMMENFILDVAKDTEADPETMRQFKQIIKYYRQSTAKQRGQDPKIDMLFKKVDEHLASYDEIVSKDKKPEEGNEESEESNASSDEVVVKEPKLTKAEAKAAAKLKKEQTKKEVDELAKQISASEITHKKSVN
jgi:hypothetical protein